MDQQDLFQLDRRDVGIAAQDQLLLARDEPELVAVALPCWLPAPDRLAIDFMITAMVSAVSPGCAIVTHEFRGAASLVPETGTAFGLRRDQLLIEIITSFFDQSGGRSDNIEAEAHRRWARATREALDALALPGGYLNLLVDDDPHRVAESCGGNVKRLLEAKRRYDLDHVFSAIPLPAKPLRRSAAAIPSN